MKFFASALTYAWIMASDNAYSFYNYFTSYPIDENQGHLLEAGFPQELVSLLEGYAGTIPENVASPPEPLPLSIPHLKIVKTAIGVLLNATIGYGMCTCLHTYITAHMRL